MSSSNCCFLTCIPTSQEAGKMVWYSHLFKNFPVCCHPHKGFGIVNKAKVDVFLELSLAFSMIQWMLAIWSLVPLPFLNPAWTSGSSRFMYCWSLAWRILSITLLACEMSAIVHSLNMLWHAQPLPLLNSGVSSSPQKKPRAQLQSLPIPPTLTPAFGNHQLALYGLAYSEHLIGIEPQEQKRFASFTEHRIANVHLCCHMYLNSVPFCDH